MLMVSSQLLGQLTSHMMAAEVTEALVRRQQTHLDAYGVLAKKEA